MILHGDTHLLRPPEELDYHDTRVLALPHPLTAVEAWNLMVAEPLPVMRTAFALRDAISARFGVKRIGGFSGRQAQTVQVGDRLDFFLVEHVSDEALVLTERDRHLDVMTTITTSGACLTVTSSVVTHNLFGRAYMLPVGFAHKVIVNALLRRVAGRLRAGDA
ncbi:DUF2867 domain-containing protein [Salipiger abyssi]|uniref:DUF2867 domain-containing protein n=1 Tax=Salipiger abyssi TaxID=1250539 RepID=UPI001A8E9727|nr:DUF2867 domain-containing protein [Salipiger abyssi]MBN9886625.1 DUF2867 domain-containing protein [Salipiger abyssi]